MLKVIQTMEHKNRTYHLCETDVGKIVYYRFDKYTQYKNLSNHDVCWSIIPTDEFEMLFSKPAIQILRSKRKKNMNIVHKFKIEGCQYHILENIIPDGYYYVVNSTLLKLYPEKDYPNAKVIYECFNKDSLRTFDYTLIQRMYEEETAKFNGNYSAAPYILSGILEAVYEAANEKKEEKELVQIALF